MAQRFDGIFDDRYGYPGYFALLECRQCGQMQTAPSLTDAELPDVYRTYYPRRQTDIESLRQQAGDPGALASRLRRWANGTDNQGQYAARPGMAVLDYGSGAGLSLLEVKRLGARGYGVETDPNAAAIASALDIAVHIGSLADRPFPGVSFDLIVLNQVLEHVPHPAKLMAELGHRLKPGGRVHIAVPNTASFYARRSGRDWINWHVPYHIHHFNPRSMRLFLSRIGWRIVRSRTITPDLWTILQLRANVERTRMGVPNPMWTGAARAEEDLEGAARRRRIGRNFALRAQRGWARACLSLFNRSLDALGRGDCLFLAAAPARTP